VVFETNLGCNNEKANNKYEEPEVENVEDTEQVPWAWIKNHAKMCKYSLDI
ncbi:15057_t:CDS:1, partial [Cetraspora pellucida]